MNSLGVNIIRDATVTLYKFTDFFQGFEKIEQVRDLFKEDTEKVLKDLNIEFFSSKSGYMGVSDDDGHIRISSHYLKTGDERSIYLDIIHELVHVRQFFEGKALFDRNYDYCDRPTEVEAYEITVEEAKKIGMTYEEIVDHLQVDWMDDEDLKKLITNIKFKEF